MIARRQLIASFGALGALAIAGTAAGQAPGLQGRWNAVIEAGAQKLRIELLIRPDGGVVLYSLDQGGASFPAEAVSLSADRIEITVPAAQATFSGRLAGGDRLEGAWKQGGGALPLVFTRGAAAALAAAPVASPLTTERLSEIRRAAAAPGLIAAAQKRGRPANVWVSGERELGSGMLVTQVDRWHIGSITKSMTATLVARLVESGRLSWDQTLESALGETAPQMRAEYKGVTLRHLLSHRSGLPAHIPLPELLRFSRDSVDARGERRAYAQTALAMTPEGAPGAKFVYSHSGYVVAGLMIERELGVPWEVALERYIFQPLRLHSAGFGAPHKSANPLGTTWTPSTGCERPNPASIRRTIPRC
jgi:CubicO group peptidase (beta-lactamase class C family)